MKSLLAISTILLSLTPVLAHADCMNEESLLSLENRWTDAFASQNLEDVRKLLHPKFTWVHDHASMIHRSPDELLSFLGRVWNVTSSSNPPSTNRDVRTIIHDGTGVVYGFNDVQRSEQHITYNFMRTYVIEGENCVVLAVHTMEVPKV